MFQCFSKYFTFSSDSLEPKDLLECFGITRAAILMTHQMKFSKGISGFYRSNFEIQLYLCYVDSQASVPCLHGAKRQVCENVSKALQFNNFKWLHNTCLTYSYGVSNFIWHIAFDIERDISARHLRTCRLITVMRTRLKVPVKNSPALLFLSRELQLIVVIFLSTSCPPAEEEQSRGILGENFRTRAWQ